MFDAAGNVVGLSFWEQAEQVRLTYLPIGRYFLAVDEFAATPAPTPVAYTIEVQRTTGAGCTSAANCASEYRNQVYRGRCAAGSCIQINGDGEVAQGGACDSESDCAAGLSCPDFFFVADADTRETCAPACAEDSECGADQVCTTYYAENFCVPRCTTDDHCPTSLGDAPETPPWYRLSCDVPSGRCM
ncbi:MAG: hypothetical protein WKG01_11780 [Kofleriaceae bacterium]